MTARLIHGTAIAVGASAVLIRGPSGAGKSDLALRCLGLSPGPFVADRVLLVADDQVIVSPAGSGLRLSAPSQIKGKLEVRGLGIVEVETVEEAWLALVVDLAAADQIDRLPEDATCTIEGVQLPRLLLCPFEASAPLKLLLCLKAALLRQS